MKFKEDSILLAHVVDICLINGPYHIISNNEKKLCPYDFAKKYCSYSGSLYIKPGYEHTKAYYECNNNR